MMQQPLNFDIPARRGRSRRTDPSTSLAAGQATNATRLESTVYSFMALMFPQGYTTKDLERELGIDRVSISPRMKPLFKKNKVQRTGERRDGCEVWRAVK